MLRHEPASREGQLANLVLCHRSSDGYDRDALGWHGQTCLPVRHTFKTRVSWRLPMPPNRTHQFSTARALVRISHHTRGDKCSPRTSRRRPQTSLGLPSLAILGDSYAM